MFKPMSYTKIPLSQLDYIRLELRAKLKRLESVSGERYCIRTFYLGPRATRQRNTNKADANAAKIGIYKVKVKNYGLGDFDALVLDRYI